MLIENVREVVRHGLDALAAGHPHENCRQLRSMVLDYTLAVAGSPGFEGQTDEVLGAVREWLAEREAPAT